MAVIFMGFILVFLICHSPRLFLNIHELATIRYVVGFLRPLSLLHIPHHHLPHQSRHAMECQDAGQNPFPLWSQIAISLSHVLLAVNSSTNIFIYCFLSSKFREECKKLYDSICRKLCVTQIWKDWDEVIAKPEAEGERNTLSTKKANHRYHQKLNWCVCFVYHYHVYGERTKPCILYIRCCRAQFALPHSLCQPLYYIRIHVTYLVTQTHSTLFGLLLSLAWMSVSWIHLSIRVNTINGNSTFLVSWYYFFSDREKEGLIKKSLRSDNNVGHTHNWVRTT